MITIKELEKKLENEIYKKKSIIFQNRQNENTTKNKPKTIMKKKPTTLDSRKIKERKQNKKNIKSLFNERIKIFCFENFLHKSKIVNEIIHCPR